MKRIIHIFILISLMFLLFTTAVFANDTVDKLTISIHKDENTLTPYTYVTGYPGIEVMRLIYDSLFLLDKDNEPTTWMVDKYSIDPKFEVYSITLHDNLKWHDGEKVTAEDIKFSFEYALKQNRSRWKRISNGIKDIEVLDDLNLKIKLKKSNPNFIVQGLIDFPIVPKHIYQGVEKAEEATEVIGSGPYRLKEYKAGQYYKFERVEDYFKGTPKVKTINMPIMVDTGAIFQALKAEQLDATTAHLTPELVSTFSNDDKIKVVSGAGLTTTLLQLNNEIYPLNKEQFRQALALAVDTSDLVETVLLGYGDRGSLGFFHPKSPWGMEKLISVADMDKSNKLLDEMGFTKKNSQGFRLDSDGNPIQFELLVYANNPLRIRTAEIIAEQLKKVGIGIKVVSMESATLDDLVWPGFDVSQGRNYEMSMWGWSASAQMQPDSLVNLFSSNLNKGILNIGGFKSEEFDALADELENTLDSDSRKKLVEDMQLLLAEEVPLVPLYYPKVIATYNSKTYDDWVMQKGVGIINKFSFLPGNNESAVNVATDNYEESQGFEKGGNKLWWIVIIILTLSWAFKGMKSRKNEK